MRTVAASERRTARTWTDASGAPVAASFLTLDAGRFLVDVGVQQLVVDLPDIDPSDDDDAAHRIFWGLPDGSRRLADATGAHRTLTELAWIPNRAAAGPYLLDLQIPAFRLDTAPSRPILLRACPVGAGV